MLDSEFLHLVNKYGADLPKEDANLYLRDACRCCWGIDDCDDKMAELSSRVDSYCYSAFPKMSSSDISKLSYSLCQCLAFEIGLIDYPDQHDVSYPGIGLIAESTLKESLMKDFMRELEESQPSVDLIEETFRSLGRKSNSRRLYFTYVDTMTVTTEDGTVVPTKYSVPVTVSYEPDDSEFEGYDDSKVEIDIDPEFESKRDEVLEAVKTMLDDDPDIDVDICNEAENHLGNF